jgi:hypothetical protein
MAIAESVGNRFRESVPQDRKPQTLDPLPPRIPIQQRTIRRRGSTHQKECHKLSRTFTGITSFPYLVDGWEAEKDTPLYARGQERNFSIDSVSVVELACTPKKDP